MDRRGEHKEIVRRAVEEVFSAGRLEVLDELFAPEAVAGTRAWVEPFRRSFPDVEMKVVELVAEGDTVVGRFTCSATHSGRWRGHEPTGRRFEAVDEVYFFRFRDGRIAELWGLEDSADRLRQLELPL